MKLGFIRDVLYPNRKFRDQKLLELIGLVESLNIKVGSLQSQLEDLRLKSSEIYQTADKILNVSATHRDTYFQRSGRPYYPLDSGWGLSFLDTGEYFFVNTADRNLTPWILMGGHWELEVGRVLLSYAQPGMVVIDIGAHQGYYTVKLARRVGLGGRVFSFEPNKEVSDVCLENIKINGLTPTVTLSTYALGDEQGTATLTRSASNMTGANLVGSEQADFVTGVEVRRLDDVVDPSLRVDLIKIDAEGYESKILKGASDLISRSPNCAFVIELGLEKWERSSDLADVLPACGGGDRVLFKISDDGTIAEIDTGDLREFLQQRPFHENYFLIARRDQVEMFIPSLLRSGDVTLA